MRRAGIARWAVLASLVASTAGEPAKGLCELQTSGDWGPVSVFTGSTSCSALDGSEEIRIPAGVTVRVVDDIVQTAVPGHVLRVASGGALRARGIERNGGPGGLELALTPQGLVCEVGSQCLFEGVYRQVGVPSPLPRDELASAGWLGAGEVVPCPGWDDDAGVWVSDCEGLLAGGADLPGTSYEVGFVYPEGAPVSPPFVAQALDAMTAGDVLCFSDPDPATPSAPVDDGFCYEITLADGDFGGAGVLKIDVRQTNPARPRNTSHPFSLREVREGSLLADTAAGARIAMVDGAVLQGGRVRERVGMWLRFADPSGAPRSSSYKIARSWNAPAAGTAPLDCPGGDGSCDVLEIYDPRGFQEAQHNGDTIWVDYGHAPGEPFFVMAPVILTEADGVQEPGKSLTLDLAGVISLGAVLVDDTATLGLSGPNVLRFEDVWLRDLTALGSTRPGNGIALKISGVFGALLRRVSLTGGNASGIGTDRIHSIGLGTLPSAFSVRTLAIRHHGDDGLTFSGQTQLDVERYRLEWATPGAESCSQIAQSAAMGSLVGSARDLLCQDCNRGAGVVGTEPANDFPIEGVARWGSVSYFDNENTSGAPVKDLLQVGGGGRLPTRVDGFVLALESGSSVLSGASHREIRNGIVRDVSTTWRSQLGTMNQGVLENVAVIDSDTTRACAPSECSVLALLGAPAFAMTVRDVTVALSPGAVTRFGEAVDAGATDTDFTVDGLLVSGMIGSTGSGFGVRGSAAATANLFANTVFGPLLHANKLDAQSPQSLPASTVLGVAPGFVDVAAGRFDTTSGSGADVAQSGIRRGVEAPGLRTYRWMHAITRTVPELMADDSDGDGVPLDPAAAVCSGGAAAGCSDNCPTTWNPDQGDGDGDSLGDLCDTACDDGVDNDGDGLLDFVGGDPGCASADGDSERSPSLPCDDGIDNDGDGTLDFVRDLDGDRISDPPGDPGCAAPAAPRENPPCQDGFNNDSPQDARIDWDGGASAGLPPALQTAPDPQCGFPWQGTERSLGACGLGFELVLLAALLSRLRRAGSGPTQTSRSR